jgi:hypothetical protein
VSTTIPEPVRRKGLHVESKKRAREYMEVKHDWRLIARSFLDALEKSGL